MTGEAGFDSDGTTEGEESRTTSDRDGTLGRVRRRLVFNPVGAIRESYLLKFASALLLIVLLISLIGFYIQGQTAETLEEDVEQQLILEAEAEASQLSELIASNEMPARVLSEHPALNGSREVVNEYVNNQMQISLPERVHAVHIVDTENETIVASTDETRIDQNVSYTPWIQQTAFRGFREVVTSEPYRNLKNETVIAFMSPVVQKNRRALVLTVKTDQIAFDKAIEGTFTETVRPVPGSTEVLFTDSPFREGELEEYIPDTSQQEIPELRDALEGNSGFRTSGTISSQLDKKYVTAYAPVEGNDWVVIKHAPANNAYQLRSEIRQGLLLFLVLALVGVVVVGGTIGRNTAGAIRKLSERATAIENGEFDVEVSSDRRDEIGTLFASIGSMRDSLRSHISELEQSRQEAEELNEQLQVLDRLLRHNLHNEMNTILLHAESIQFEGSETVNEYAGTIIEKSNQLLAKTDKQREITRALATEDGPQRIDVTILLENITSNVQEDHPDASISLDMPDSATAVVLSQLDEAFLELVENSIIHNDSDEPEVEITVRRVDDEIRIEMADNGPTIPESDRQVLLGNQEIGSLNHGSGIGLWLVFWIVRRSGGELDYDWNEPRGNVITVVLDAADEAE
jgi:signal transduction histidine kinase